MARLPNVPRLRGCHRTAPKSASHVGIADGISASPTGMWTCRVLLLTRPLPESFPSGAAVYAVMTYIVMAYVLMARRRDVSERCRGLCSYDVCSYGLCTYGPSTRGLRTVPRLAPGACLCALPRTCLCTRYDEYHDCKTLPGCKEAKTPGAKCVP